MDMKRLAATTLSLFLITPASALANQPVATSGVSGSQAATN
jgi:hypothetical protein